MVNRNDLDALAESIAVRNSQAMAELRDHITTGMNTNTTQTNAELSKCKESLTQIQKEITEVKLMVETRMTALEKRVSEVEKKGPVEDPLTLMHQELQQLNIRKNNVVIHGLKEGEHDHEQANEFMMATEPGESLDFQVLYRAGKRGPRPRTLIVKFKDEKQKNKVLDNAKNLKNKEEFKGIALAPDLTKKQREMDKQRGTELGEEADRLNSQMTEDQKKEGSWVVVGRYEKRRLIKKPMP